MAEPARNPDRYDRMGRCLDCFPFGLHDVYHCHNCGQVHPGRDGVLRELRDRVAELAAELLALKTQKPASPRARKADDSRA